jgi:hypothetical protein
MPQHKEQAELRLPAGATLEAGAISSQLGQKGVDDDSYDPLWFVKLLVFGMGGQNPPKEGSGKDWFAENAPAKPKQEESILGSSAVCTPAGLPNSIWGVN